MRVLVTGGAGYIGSVVAEELLQAGHQVVVFDNLSHGHREAVPKNAELVGGDTADRACLDQLFRSRAIDAVMHFAALIEAGESMKAPEEFFRNNTSNALTLLEAMLAARVKRFVFSSTAALYGNPKRIPIEEDDPVLPTNAYGESKLLVERMLAWFHQIHGLRYASLRYFNAAGAYRPDQGEAHQPETHLIPRILQVALGRAEHANIFGTDYPTSDGTCVRDYIHVNDLADAHVRALQYLDRSGNEKGEDSLALNLGAGRGYSVLEVIRAVEYVTGRAVRRTMGPRRAGDPPVLVADPAKAQSLLGWGAKRNFSDIVSSAWAWMRKIERREAA